MTTGPDVDLSDLPADFGGYLVSSTNRFSVMRDAAVCMESRARWAWQTVVCTWVWPKRFPIIVRLWPKVRALDVYECLKS